MKLVNAALLWRLALSAVLALGTAILSAIVSAIVEMYLAGHALGSIMKPLIDWPALGIHLSPADVFLLCAACTAGWLTFHMTGKVPGPPR
jgi:hypothetical protein